jgi:cyclopropane-fatty-acyl-phospholipid synthase
MSDAETPERTGWSARNALNPSGLPSRLLVNLASRIEVGQLSLMLPKGVNTVVTGRLKPDSRAVLDVRNPWALLRRVALKGSNGFAEAYVDGQWDSPDLVALLQIALESEPAMGKPVRGLGLARAVDRLWHVVRANTRRGSRRNIAFHYDLGNDFYDLWLDPGMTYSSALFDTAGQSLVDAQDNKYRRLADSLGLRPGHHVLEIGCGWGGFAMMAARDYGCRVTAITLSEQQLRYAEDRVRRAGLADRVEVRLQDYRDVPGQFDRIASIEMFEAVGEERWPVFFDTVRERLKLGGIAALQVITIEDSRFEQYRRSADFIQRYIFPGGMLPSPSALARAIDRAGLTLSDVFAFGPSYAETLAAWQRRFQRSWPQIRRLGFDGRFKRLWELYLAYCEAGFRAGAIDVAHYRIERG